MQFTYLVFISKPKRRTTCFLGGPTTTLTLSICLQSEKREGGNPLPQRNLQVPPNTTTQEVQSAQVSLKHYQFVSIPLRKIKQECICLYKKSVIEDELKYILNNGLIIL